MISDEDMMELEIMSKMLQHGLEKGELDWNDERVQYFIPVVLFHTNFEWLNLIAKNTLIEEDEKIVKDFLSMVEGLKDLNSVQLHNAVKDKLDKLFR